MGVHSPVCMFIERRSRRLICDIAIGVRRPAFSGRASLDVRLNNQRLSFSAANCGFHEGSTMKYAADLMVELIARGDVSQTQIAERLGVSRRTVWRIATGRSRPGLQRKIADTVEGYRQETIRLAARWMKPLLKKQIEVGLETDGETARKCREFLLKTFVLTLPANVAKAAAKRNPNPNPKNPDGEKQVEGINLYGRLSGLSQELKDRILDELGGPPDETPAAAEAETKNSPPSPPPAQHSSSKSDAPPPSPSPLPTPVAKPLDKPIDRHPLTGKDMRDPYASFVTLPNGKRIYAETVRLIEEAEAEAAKMKPVRRVKRAPKQFHYP